VKRELPTNVYRWDASGKLEVVVTEEQVPDPNGILFSPDHKKLYVISTGKGPGDTGPGGKGVIYVFDVGVDNKLSNQKLFTDCVVDGALWRRASRCTPFTRRLRGRPQAERTWRRTPSGPCISGPRAPYPLYP